MRENRFGVKIRTITVFAVACFCLTAVAAQPFGATAFQAAPAAPAAAPGGADASATSAPKPLEEITSQPAAAQVLTVKDDDKVTFNPPTLFVDPPKVELSKDEQKILRDRIEYWKNVFLQSKSDIEVMKAKDKLIEDYLIFVNRNDESKANQSPDYQVAFTKIAASVLGPLLNKGLREDDSLKKAKEVDLSMVFLVLSQIWPTPADGKEFRGSVDIGPVVERMVEHENPAVRYFGWRAYKNLRIQILANIKDDKPVARMKTLISNGQNETSAVVLGSYFGMLNFPATDPLYGVKDSVLNDFRKECYGILKTLWVRWEPAVWQGDVAVTNAFLKGLECMKDLAPVGVKELNGKKVILQNVLDLLYCSAGAFERRWNGVPVNTDKGRFDSWFQYLKSEFETNNRRLPPGSSGIDDQIIQANVVLSQECEKTLEALTEMQKGFVMDAWKAADVIMVGQEGAPRKPVINDRSEKILETVKKWADALKEQGVDFPKITEPSKLSENEAPLPTPASRPATQPAPAPVPPKK